MKTSRLVRIGNWLAGLPLLVAVAACDTSSVDESDDDGHSRFREMAVAGLNRVRNRFGLDKTATLLLTDFEGKDIEKALGRHLTRLGIAPQGSASHTAEGVMTIVFGPVPDFDALVRGIDFGTVTGLDETNHVIQVEIDRDAFPDWVEETDTRPLDTSRSDFLEVAAGALKSRDSIRQLEALNGLNLVEPSGDRDAMARAIEEVLLDPDAIVRARALYALQKWATPESYDAVVPMLTDADGGVRAAALGCIRWLKDPRYAADVAPHLADPGDRSYAADALIDMGSEAEEAALSMADHPDADVLAQVCRVLGQIGTRKSEPILERLNRQTGSVGVAAGAALAAIRERERSNGG